jgi:hypothetical protein
MDVHTTASVKESMMAGNLGGKMDASIVNTNSDMRK